MYAETSISVFLNYFEKKVSEMYESLRKLLAKQLRIDESKITPDAEIKKDLGADSLDIMQLLFTVEEEYGITIPDEELVTFTKVSDIVNYLESLKK